MSDATHHVLHLLRAIANTQRQHGELLECIAAMVAASGTVSSSDAVKMLKLTAELKASHDRLQAALDAAPPTPPA